MKFFGAICTKTQTVTRNATKAATELMRHAVDDYKTTGIVKRAWHSPINALNRDFHTVHIYQVIYDTKTGYTEYHGDALHGDEKNHYVWLMTEKTDPRKN
jgi:hypothetical protein